MRKLVYYIAATVDSFIAGQEGEFDFLIFDGDLKDAIIADYPETLPGPARAGLGIPDAPNQRFDTILMGWATYEPGLKLGWTSPYPQLKQYVFSRSREQLDPAVEIVSDKAVEFVRDLKQQDGKDIWLCGGATLATELFEEIDELIIKRNPVVLGAGIPLFNAPVGVNRFQLAGTRTFDVGVVIENYVKA